MKKALRLFALLSGLLITDAVMGQNPAPSYLDTISDAIHRSLQDEMPAVRCQRGQPIKGSGVVLVESCFIGESVIKLSVIPFASKDLAKSQFRELAALKKDKEIAQDTGDEGYTWGYRKSKTAFTKDKYNVFVSINNGEVVDADKIVKRFAKVIA